MRKNPLQRGAGERSSGAVTLARAAVIGLLLLTLLLLFVVILRPQPPQGTTAVSATDPGRERLPRTTAASQPSPDVRPQAAPAVWGPLTPKPMRLIRRVLLDKKWDSAPDALGRTLPPEGEGTIVGPTSVACVGDAIYVLDRSNQRVAVYDAAGAMVSSVALPGKAFGDLVVNPGDASVLLVDQIHETVSRISRREATEAAVVPLKDISLGLMFGYDEHSGTLYVHSPELDGDIPVMVRGRPVEVNERTVQALSPVKGDYEEANPRNILLKFKDGRELRVGFEVPVQCVDELTMDRQGIVWVLYTLQGDYQVRRLARVDPLRQTAGVAVLDVFFVYDVARHMAPSGNGVVLVAGDRESGRLLSFEYADSL